MADKISQCKLEFPKISEQQSTHFRSAKSIDAEDAKYSGPLLGFALCKTGELFKALLSGYAAVPHEKAMP